jgi:mRNA-degrading endonuclease YafQ of YafQ-DinJ toxin-antitoxin module
MLVILFKPTFVRKYQKLELELQEEVLEKIALLKNPKNHRRLRVHKLTGHLSGNYSFYINYKIRVVFSYLSRKEAVLLTIGDHDIYK